MNTRALPSLGRRHFLRGLGGITLGLPFLEGLAPRTAAAREAGVIRRLGVFFACNGVDMTRWFPRGPYGALTDAHLEGTANAPLIPFRRQLLVPRGLHMAPRGGGRDPGGGDAHRGLLSDVVRGPARVRRIRGSRPVGWEEEVTCALRRTVLVPPSM